MTGNIPLLIRFISISWAVLVLLWLSTEDVSTIAPVIAGFIGISLVMWNWLQLLYADGAAGATRQLVIAVLFGAVIGAGTILGSVLLMFFKTAWHAHAFPDYPLLMMMAMLERAPSWALAGALCGAAIWLLRLSVRDLNRDTFRKAISTSSIARQRQDLDHS